MHKRILLLASLLASGLQLMAQPYSPNEIIIQTTTPDAQHLFEAVGLGEIGSFHFTDLSTRRNLWLVRCPQGVAEVAISRLRSLPEVEFVQRNYQVSLRTDPNVACAATNDPLFDDQWALEKIGATCLWDITTGGTTLTGDTIVVAVLDSGCDLDHEDLLPRIWRNRGEIPNDGIDNDTNGYTDDYFGWRIDSLNDHHRATGHGTFVSGIAGATGQNDKGISGVNHRIKIMIVSGIRNDAELALACDYIINARQRYNDTNGATGAFVTALNLSLGIDAAWPEEHPLWCQALDDLGAVGIVSVGAVANDPIDVDIAGDIPTTCPSEYLIGVTATDASDTRFDIAAWGQESVDLGAPGVDVTSAYLNNGYDTGSGTSYAAPHVSGAIGLLYSLPIPEFMALAKSDPPAAALIVRQAILDGAEPVFSLTGVTATDGRLNVWRSALAMRDRYGMAWAEADSANGGATLLLDKAFVTRAGDKLVVRWGSNDFAPRKLRISNMLGQVVHERDIDVNDYFEKTLEIPATYLPHGVYVLTIGNGNKIQSATFPVYHY